GGRLAWKPTARPSRSARPQAGETSGPSSARWASRFPAWPCRTSTTARHLRRKSTHLQAGVVRESPGAGATDNAGDEARGRADGMRSASSRELTLGRLSYSSADWSLACPLVCDRWNSLGPPDSDSPLKEAQRNCRPGSRLSGRGRRLEVLDDVIQFLVELLERVPPTVEVVAEVSHERRRVRRLLEFRRRRAEQLGGGRVELRAVGALHRPGCRQRDQVLPLQRDVRLTELELLEQLPSSAQGEFIPLEVVEEARNESERPFDIF